MKPLPFFLILVSLATTPMVLAFPYHPNLNYTYPDTKYFHQKLDHFDPTVDFTFPQRYLISKQYWDMRGGPIFFYTGNEGDIEVFCNNTGFMWDIAPQFNAMVVFAEHRYYGKSSPFPDAKLTPENIKKFAQFTVEQALADFAELILYLKKTIDGAENSQVIAFGGSYGGMLAAWLRRKYPHIVLGALAASAPVRYFPGHVDCSAYNKIVTHDFARTTHGLHCVENIKLSWNAIENMAKQPDGLRKLTDTFNLCNSLKEVDDLENWLSEAWSSLAMVNYPYPTSFLNPLPAWPVEATCKFLGKSYSNGPSLLEAIRDAAGVFYNYTGQVSCFDTSSLSPGLDDSLWNFQTCTEMVMPFCSNPASDMFKPSNYSFDAYKKNCQKMLGVTPRPDWAILQFGGDDWSEQSNVIFSNGELDPWQVGGVFKSSSPGILPLYLEDAAHHLDLRHQHPLDPSAVTTARRVEMETIAMWLKTSIHL